MKLYYYREERDGPEWLTTDPTKGVSVRLASASEVSAIQIAVMLDLDAEGANEHGFVGTHAWIVNHSGLKEMMAKMVLMRLAKVGGLHGVRRQK